MPENNVFTEEWRACLREHYKHVVQHDTATTLDSLRAALLRPNGVDGDQPPIFTEDEVRQFHLEATMRAEDMPDDFVPDFEAVMPPEDATPAPPLERNPAHPLECQCPACVGIEMIPHDADGQPLDEEALAELEAEQQDDEDKPQQMSMF